MSNSSTATKEALARYQQLIQSLPVRLFRHCELSMPDRLSQLASVAEHWSQPDYYGSGELINQFESEMAALFGKPGGLFMPSGTMAQAMALRMVADQKQCDSVAVHASSHLLLHEQQGYEYLWRLQPQLIGQAETPISMADLQAMQTLPVAVLTEIPARELGGQLPEWDDLVAQANWAKENGVNFHLDGARIWCCACVYGKDFAQIGDLFDVIYLSFYKDLDGISGAMLLADQDFIDSARVWRRRCGGDLIHHYPAILSAKIGFEKHIPAMADYVEQAKLIAHCFARHSCFRLIPDPPQTNLFHLLIDLPKAQVLEVLSDFSRDNQLVLLPAPRNLEDHFCRFEITIGDSLSQKRNHIWAEAIDQLAGRLNQLRQVE